MAATTAMLPNQQQQQQPQFQEQVPYRSQSQSVLQGDSSSGSIGPFFAVISVLAVLAIISCILGRFCVGKEESPLESIKYRGSCFDRLKRRCRRCFRGDIEVGGGRGVKVASVGVPDDKGGDGN